MARQNFAGQTSDLGRGGPKPLQSVELALPKSEQVIHKVLERFVRNRTTIIITHRLSTLALADRIVVMNAGRLLDVGRHEELLRRCELYGRLHDLQFRESA